MFFSPCRADLRNPNQAAFDFVSGCLVRGTLINHPVICYRADSLLIHAVSATLYVLPSDGWFWYEILNKRFKSCRCHVCHVQCLTHRRPFANAAAFDFGFLALPRVRGNVGLTRYPFVRQPLQFGQYRHQRSRRYRTDAFDLLRHLGFAVKMRVGVVVDLFVQIVNQLIIKWAICCLTLLTCVS